MADNPILGTDNNDFLTDTNLNDDIMALNGDDQIEVTAGDDTVDGGEGNDELVLNYSELNEDLQIFLNSYFDGYSNSGSADIYFSLTGNNNYISFNNIELFTVLTGSGNDNIDFGYSDSSNNEVDAGAGNDYIFAGLGNNTINGGSGFDYLRLDFSMLAPEMRVVSELTSNDSGQYQFGSKAIAFDNIEAVEIFGSQNDDVLVALTSNINLDEPVPHPTESAIDGGEGKDQLVADYSEHSEDLMFNLQGYGNYNGYDYPSFNGSLDVSSYETNYNSRIIFNNIESFVFTSGSGNDYLDLGYENTSDDRIDAGAGNDTIQAGIGSDTIDGGNGFDLLQIDFGRMLLPDIRVVSELTNNDSGQYQFGSETIEFHNIEALEIYGSHTDDVLVALTSNNNDPTINPVPMNQMIDGAEGKDQLVADYSDRSEDLEIMLNSYGGYYDGYGNHSMNGSINAYAYNEGNYSNLIDFNNIEGFTLTSGSGNDRLELGYDNQSDDNIDAGAGDDYISAGLGSDTIDGGSGFDILNLDFGMLTPEMRVVSELVNGEIGEYEYQYGLNTIKFRNIEAVNVMGSQGDDTLIALTGNNNMPSMNPMPMNQMINGNDGKDRLVADYSDRSEDLELMLNSYGSYDDGYGNYSMSGSINTYGYNYGNYSNLIDFNSIEGFTITSGSGNDRLELGYDNMSDDKVDAGAGDDWIKAGLGNDTIDGGSGFDILQLEYFNSPNSVGSFLIDGNSGEYSNGYDTVKFTNIEAINVIGSNYNDVLVALTGNNNMPSMNPMPMNQMIDGNDGKDRLVADYSDRSEDLEVILSGSGYDDGYGNYSMSGSINTYGYNYGNYSNLIDFNSIEGFTITSGSGNDRLELGYDNMSDDKVDAGAGDDWIKAGLGNDTIDGGSGFDVLQLEFFNSFDGISSLLTDGNSGEYSDGINTIKFDNIESLNVIGSNYNDVLVALTGNNNVPSMNPMPMNQMIDGGEGEDKLVADYSDRSEDLQFSFNAYGDSGSANVSAYLNGNYNSFFDFNSIESFELASGKGDDIISLGFDTFTNDLINAGDGNDLIMAGWGDDTLNGGKGNDTYLYELGHGTDVISEMSGNDTLSFGAGISLENISLDFADDNLIISVDDATGDRVIIKDYAISGNTIENIELDGQIFSIEAMIEQVSDPEPEIGKIGEFGLVENFDQNSQTIQLEHNFENPVVFALPLSRNGEDPSVVRITDIQSDSFTAYLQEAEYKNGLHAEESFSYMVLEAGTWELENGALLEVGTVDTDKTTQQGWEQINFDADFGKLPVILSQVQTNLDDEFVRTRQYQASVDGFKLSMEEEEALRHSGHGQETVGWLAMDSGLGDFGDLQYQAGHTGRRIKQHSAQINFSQDFADIPSLFASISTFYGADASGLRYESLDLTQATIMLEEDQSRDNEIGHTKENVDFLAIAGTGDLTAIAYEPDFS